MQIKFESKSSMDKEKNETNIPWWQPGLVLFTRLSAWIAVPVIIAVFVGKKLDKIFNSSPWLTLTCVIVSFIVSIVMLVRIGLREIAASEKEEETKNKKVMLK